MTIPHTPAEPFHKLPEDEQAKIIKQATEASNSEQHELLHPAEPEPETITLLCLNCGKPREVRAESPEAKGIFNVFCDGECEDRYAWKQ